jgi:hypothetical protein
MKLEINDVEGTTYQNFVDSLGIKRFLENTIVI